MAAAKNLDPHAVRRAYLKHGANVRAAAVSLGTSRETVYVALRALPPLVVPTVRVPNAELSTDDTEAVALYLRAALDRAGILKERPGG